MSAWTTNVHTCFYCKRRRKDGIAGNVRVSLSRRERQRRSGQPAFACKDCLEARNG